MLPTDSVRSSPTPPRFLEVLGRGLLLLALAFAHARPASANEAELVPAAIRDAVLAASRSDSALSQGRLPRNEMVRFYAAANFAPAWFDEAFPRRQASQAVELLSEAGSHGLDPADYDAASLSERLRSIGSARPVPPQQLATFDVALTLSFFRYLAEVHAGRVRPRDVGARLELEPSKLDLPRLVRDAIMAERVREAAALIAPRYPMYARLRAPLAHYRALSGDDSLRPLTVVGKLEPGALYAGSADLRHLLIALGDLPAGAAQTTHYSAELVDAVKRFQARHGLEPDGVIGRATFEQLNTPLTRRVRQIELALERMRWIPSFESERVIAVNIPEFRLRAFDFRDGGVRTRLNMKVIVGRALDTQTPVFEEEMRYIEFSPYWNVPPSIARAELIPKLRRNPGYLDREGMEFVSTGRDARVTTEVSAGSLSALARGELRLRQRPGPGNALGEIKFVFPNNMDIYLHHTPATQLFERSRRDFSHGCIRVEQPVELAKFVLEDQPEWTEERIRQAMQAGKPSIVPLARPIPVVIFYTTALVEGDGRVLFLADIYRHDALLERALATRSAAAR